MSSFTTSFGPITPFLRAAYGTHLMVVQKVGDVFVSIGILQYLIRFSIPAAIPPLRPRCPNDPGLWHVQLIRGPKSLRLTQLLQYRDSSGNMPFPDVRVHQNPHSARELL